MTSDLELLRDYASRKSQDAFTELVRRHLNLVYSAALRQVCSTQLAEEVSQSVFIDLARDVNKLKEDTILTAWLYQVTRRTAIDVVRRESRRQARERIAVEMAAMNTAADWTQIAPLLDDAMNALDETDRTAILLRYFENKSLREVGLVLGTSDDTAQKRVSRAVERLREFFSKRGAVIGASGLVVIISSHAVQAAPAGLTTAISSTIATGTLVKASAVITATKTIAMTTLQKTIIGATLAAAVGAGIFEAHRAAQSRDELDTIKQQQSALAAQVAQLTRERDDVRQQLASANEENAKLKSGEDINELLKLRGQVGSLRSAAAVNSSNTPATAVANLMNNSTSKELTREQLHDALKYKYASLIHQLNLSSENADKFLGLLIDNEMKKKETLANLLKGDLDVNTALQLRDAGKVDLNNELAALLGDSGYAQYGQYNHEATAAEAVKRLNDLLGNLALNADQTKRMQTMLAADPVEAELDLDEVDLFRSKESLDALYQKLVDVARHDLDQAATILSPQQLAATVTLQSNALESIRRRMTLGQQLISGAAK